ncbi:winged helix DNA-binding domain-containing protein [Nocardioides aestuarii]|uniref:DNA glycosylase AlkZ-like family protein n=1 Tax=Nocardioides aestuarii TaxID=252231 RepID=A0ABW4TRK8_9ACTN
MSIPTASWGQALAWRSQRQLLVPRGPVGATEVVTRLGAVLAMDESLADLAVAARSTTARGGDLTRALADGSLVQVFAFRGAMHYVSPAEGGSYLALRCAGRQWELPSWVEHYRLSPEDWPGFRATVREALRGGPLTVAELGEAVSAHRAYRHLRPTFEDGAGTLLKPLTWQGDMSLGPRRDGQLTLQSLEGNPAWRGVPDLDDAGPDAIRAYLRSYGPATPDHVHHWLGSGLSAGRRRLDRWWGELVDELAAIDVDGTTAYVVTDDLESLLASAPTGSVRLLPGHDQWVMGPGTKDEHVVPAELRDLVTRKANLVVADGVVAGTWSRRGGDVEVRWLGDGTPPQAAIDEETARLSE